MTSLQDDSFNYRSSGKVKSEKKSLVLEIDFQMMVQHINFAPNSLAYIAKEMDQKNSTIPLEDEIRTAVEKALGELFTELAKDADPNISFQEYATFIAGHYKKLDKWRLYDEVHYEDFDELWVQFKQLRQEDKGYSVFAFIDEYVTDEHREKRRRAGG